MSLVYITSPKGEYFTNGEQNHHNRSYQQVLNFWYGCELIFFVTIWALELCCNLRCWAFSKHSFWVVSQFNFLSSIKTWDLQFCCSLNFWVFVTILCFEFCLNWVFGYSHNLSFRVLSQFQFLVLKHFFFFFFFF